MTLYVADCRRCGAKRMSFDVYGVSTQIWSLPYRTPVGTRYHRAIELACRCHECSSTTIFELSAEAESDYGLPKVRFEENENPTSFGYREVKALPGSHPLPTPTDTPEPAATFYKQGAAALASGLFDASGAMFRKCLESVTRTDNMIQLLPDDDREKYCSSWLKARINKLKEIHAIPPALGDLVDVIKEEGDDAVHDDVLYDRDSAQSLQLFTKTFLEQVFTIPAQIKRVRAKRVAD